MLQIKVYLQHIHLSRGRGEVVLLQIKRNLLQVEDSGRLRSLRLLQIPGWQPPQPRWQTLRDLFLQQKLGCLQHERGGMLQKLGWQTLRGLDLQHKKGARLDAAPHL